MGINFWIGLSVVMNWVPIETRSIALATLETNLIDVSCISYELFFCRVSPFQSIYSSFTVFQTTAAATQQVERISQLS